MGREVRRVPLDFDWPIDKLWEGFLLPERLHGKKCPDCENGWTRYAQYLQDQWYGDAPFDLHSTGSTPWTADHPMIRARAERNVRGERAIRAEAQRLADHFNQCWSHHLSQEDVDVLIEEGRLHNFTHDWVKGTGWVEKDPTPQVTAAQVNEWSIGWGLGHDAINSWVVVAARCKRAGASDACATCEGHSEIEAYPGQREEADAWEPTDPPEGEGWQLWTTTTEGSPMTPVFATAEELARHCADTGVSVFGHDTASYERWMKIITGEDFAHVEVAPGVIVM